MKILLLKLWHNTLFSQLNHFLFCFFVHPMKGGHSLVVTSTDPIKTTLNDSQSKMLTGLQSFCSRYSDQMIQIIQNIQKIQNIQNIQNIQKLKIFCSRCSDQFMLKSIQFLLWSIESKVANCAALLAEKPKREPVLMMGIMGRWVQQALVPVTASDNFYPSSLCNWSEIFAFSIILLTMVAIIVICSKDGCLPAK